MYEVIYLEPDAEITSVINRLKKNEKDAIALVVPRGATLAQSIVNLKLLKRSAEEIGKHISIISTDKISRNLASQIGLTVFAKASEAEKAEIDPDELSYAVKGIKVNNYYNKKISQDESDVEEDLEEDDEINSLDEHEDDEEKELKAAVRKGIEEDRLSAEEDIEEAPVQPDNDQIARKSKPSSDKISLAESKKDDKFDRKEDNKDLEGKMSKKRKVFFSILALLIVAVLGVGYVFIPIAEAEVVMKTEDVKFEKQFTVDKNANEVNAEKLIIPGKIIESQKELSETFNATGKKDLGTKATGKITVSNSYNTNSFVLPKGSKFSSLGKIFISNADVSVPGFTATTVPVLDIKPGTVEISVIAESSGDAYNIEASSFSLIGLSLDKQKAITGKSSAPMTGGLSKQINVIQDSDLTAAEKSLLDQTKKLQTEVINKAKDENLVVFEDEIKREIITSGSDKKEGDEADTFNYVVSIKFFILGYYSKDLTQVVGSSLQSIVGEGKMLINPEQVNPVAELISSDIDSGVMSVKAVGKYKVGNELSKDEIITKIKGKKIGSARIAAESIEGVYSAKIILKPSVFRQVPYIKNRINVNFGFASE